MRARRTFEGSFQGMVEKWLQAAGYRLQALRSLVKNMKDFKKLMIWQMGMDIVDKVYDMVPLFPSEEKYGVRSQITRCAISIPGNVAEGSAKTSQKDYRRYLEIALGSSFELETHLLVVQRRKWIEEKAIVELVTLVNREQKMLQSFIKIL